MRKKIKIITLCLVTVTLMLTACTPAGHNFSGKQLSEPFQRLNKPTTGLRVGLFKHRDSAPLSTRHLEPLEETPQVLWTRMRHSFELDYPENHPRVKKFINNLTRSNYYMNKLSKNASPYLHLIVEEIDKRSMPLEIALLPMIESNFEPAAISRTGADGLWQIMPATGKILGLSQDHWYDGRRDVLSSTYAALSHLQYLYRTFEGDWLLALAAYNSGERRVMRAISQNKKQRKPTDFWSLKLPKETQDYVPKLLALISIVKNPSKYGVTLPSIPNTKYVELVRVNQQIDLKIASTFADVDHKELERLNPAYLRGTTHPKGPHHLLLPISCVPKFNKHLRRTDPVRWVASRRYQIQPGDNLTAIARKFNTKVSLIKSVNGITSNTIHPGKFINIPGENPEKNQITHVVSQGDSLWSISKKYKIPLNELIAWNNLEKDQIKPGQKLVINEA